MDENGMSDSQARNSLSNTPTHHVWSLIERVMEKQRCETIRHNFFFFCIILKKIILAKKKMNKRKPPPPPRAPPAQKPTSCKKKKLQTKKAKGGKAAASSGEREEQETKGTSAVISRSNPLFFFPELARTAHSRFIICLIRRTFSARS